MARLTEEQKNELAKKLHDAYLSEMKEAIGDDDFPYEGPDDESYSEDFGVWLDGGQFGGGAGHDDIDISALVDDEDENAYNDVFIKALPPYDELLKYVKGESSEEQPEDKPHDTELAGDTTLEEELMLNPNMSPEEFSKIAAEKRGAKKGEPAPDMNLGNVLSDSTQKNIIRTLSAHRW